MPDTGIGGGHVTALDGFVAEQGLALTRFAYLICGDRHRAEDLVQDVLLAMHRRFGASITADDPVAYARRAIVNANVSWSRRRWSRDLLVDEPPDHGVLDTDRIVEDELWRSLSTLPPRQRAVLVMRYYAGYSDVDIADALSCRRATVRSLAARGLADLRRGLEPRAATELTGPGPDGGAS
jgi:RNA polymerase sigma-70 factor (sigma-E family)